MGLLTPYKTKLVDFYHNFTFVFVVVRNFLVIILFLILYFTCILYTCLYCNLHVFCDTCWYCNLHVFCYTCLHSFYKNFISVLSKIFRNFSQSLCCKMKEESINVSYAHNCFYVDD